MAGSEHVLDGSRIHQVWNNAIAPAISIESGDVVHCATREVTNGQVVRGCDASVLAKVDFANIYPLAGPIEVKNAVTGDVLQIDVLDLRPQGWGWTGFIPGLGLLAEDFPYPYIQHWDLSNGKTTEFRPGVVIPLEPFCGVMGVAPADAGEFSILPPGRFGGNMDIRHLTRGNTLLLPVQVDGALFSAGDCHSAQGDGEVCGTGIESPMEFSLRLTVRKDLHIKEPQFIQRCPSPGRPDSSRYFCTTSTGPDLYKNSQNATRYMIQHLQDTYGLTREDSYILCSVAVDLRISEIVDGPNWIVSACLPLNIFEEAKD